MPSLQLLLQTHSQLLIVITLGPVNALISSGISQVLTESTSSSISLSLHLFTFSLLNQLLVKYGVINAADFRWENLF